MAHQQQKNFCNSVKEKFPKFFDQKFVVDIGSLDINGNNQYLFTNSNYMGVDLFCGRNVDVSSKGHELGLPDESVDVVISTECFEHDSHYEKTIKNIYRMLKPGGLFVFSCATTGRPEHGTRRTTPEDAPFIQSLGDWADYYKNLNESDIRAIFDIDSAFSGYEFSSQHETHDLYFWGIKKGNFSERNDYSFLIDDGIIGKFREKIKEAEETNKKLLDDLDNFKSVVESHKDELERTVNDVEFYKVDNKRLKHVLDNVEARANRFENLHSKILTSLSWKITKPIRFFGRVLRLEFDEAFAFFRRYDCPAIRKIFFARIFNVIRYLIKRDFAGLVKRIGHYRQDHAVSAIQKKMADNSSYTVCIVTPGHTNFIAKLISDRFIFHGMATRINNEMPLKFHDDLYIILCPQIFEKLPPGEKRIVYQLEQSVSSRWFDRKYFEILVNSVAVLDYSLGNIDFLATKNVVYPHVNYLPIGTSSSYGKDVLPSNHSAEILFYGDSLSSPRRQKMLSVLSKHYKVDVVNNLFGNEMVSRLKAARIVINLHYYEGSLLEMPRIQECLSLGIPVVSETSQDQNQYPELDGAVIFFEEGSISKMLDAVSFALDRVNVNVQKSVSESSLKFDFMFDRFLVSMGLLPSSHVSKMILPLPKDKNIFGLSMPETIARRKLFLDVKPKDCIVFDGVRRKPGWVGCGLSYAALARHAKANNMATMTVMEDDVILPPDFNSKFESINRFLDSKQGDWDVFSGVIAALNPDAEVISVEDFEGQKFITINRMTSTVFNVYAETAINMLADWDSEDLNSEINTIDRYLENKKAIKIITTLPFFVGHREEVHSTLWGFQNTTYIEMIANSQTLLEAKMASFLAK